MTKEKNGEKRLKKCVLTDLFTPPMRIFMAISKVSVIALQRHKFDHQSFLYVHYFNCIFAHDAINCLTKKFCVED